MRVFSLLTALVVMIALYMLVFERERLIEFAASGSMAGGQEAGAAADPSSAVPSGASTAAGAAGNGEAGSGAGAAPAGGRLPAVVVRRYVAGEFPDALLLRGSTEASRRVQLRAETAGRVISEPRRKGSRVAAGEVLCRLDPGTRQQALREAQARLAQAELDLEAARGLVRDGFASAARLNAAQAAYDGARAAVAAAEREISRLEITAPFGGILESDSAELGSLLQPGMPCATVIRLDPIRLVGFVPEGDLGRVRVGAPAVARLVSGRELRGQVSFLGRAADPLTRTFRLEVDLPNPDGAVRAGQTVEIVVVADSMAAHLLPQSALTLDDDGTLGVRTVTEDARVRFLPVRVLRDTPEGIWVAGLPEVVEVIVVGQEYVTDGVEVIPVRGEPGQ